MELCHGVAPVQQPSPAVNLGGDCFACATLGMVKHFWPDQAAALSVPDVIEWWRHENGAVQNTMTIAGRVLASLPDPFRLEVHTDPFVPNQRRDYQAESPWWYPDAYEQRTEAYLAAGYVGFTSVNFDGAQRFLAAEVIPEGKPHAGQRYRASADHNALIDGRRDFWGSPGGGSRFSALEREIHVVCSVKGGYWIAISELLEMHGGMFIWWCRPKSY